MPAKTAAAAGTHTAWSRAAAALAVHRVLHDKRSLDAALANPPQALSERDRPLVRELSYGVLRHYWPLAALAEALLSKPSRAQDPLVLALALVGLYQIEYTRVPDYAAIGETVNAARLLGKPWASRLLNGVLRRFQRQREQLLSALPEAARYSCPHWLLQRLRRAWPGHWRAIVDYNNSKPPLTLRLDTRRLPRDEYLALLAAQDIAAHPCATAADGVTLAAGRVTDAIPHFPQGLVSVQDESAQLVAPLLAPRPGHVILDACAAPGGKTCHLLQLQPAINLIAVDHDHSRLLSVGNTLQRTSGRATLLAADAATLGRWWEAAFFDRILLDAPCSGTGVIARHPDIKHLRRENDIAEYAKIQRALLQSCWRLLKPGGRLVYASCSVLPEENHEQIRRFLRTHSDARLQPPAVDGVDCGAGVQRLPGVHGGDGFFYACLERAAG